jgi:hypothetical protein
LQIAAAGWDRFAEAQRRPFILGVQVHAAFTYLAVGGLKRYGVQL